MSLEIKVLDSNRILITEHKLSDCLRNEIYGNTFHEYAVAIKSGKKDKIPAIIALQNPFDSIDDAVLAYKKYVESVPRQGGVYYAQEESILREILDQNILLCYNGNRRLTAFQNAKLPIKVLLITSQEEYDMIPEKERRIRVELKDKSPVRYQIDKNYVLSFLSLLDDAVYIHAEKRHFDYLDTGKLIAEMKERRKRVILNKK